MVRRLLHRLFFWLAYFQFGFSLHNLIIFVAALKVFGGKNLSLWQELESLQKKRTELDDQLLSVVEKEQNFLERMTIIIEGIEIQGEHMRELELQLKDKYEAVSRLESRIVELEKTLKKPEKELMEMTVQTAAIS